MPETTARRRDAEENRIALLDAAARLLPVDPDASLEAIAAEAGLTRRAVYGHYANRDELVGATLDRGAARIAAAVTDLEVGDPRIALAALGARLWDSVEHVRIAASFAVRGPQVGRVATALAPVRDLLARILTAGAADGSLRSDIPTATLAPLVEQAAIAVLGEATRSGLSRAEGHRLVMLIALSTAGLSATDATTIIDATPELRHPAPLESSL